MQDGLPAAVVAFNTPLEGNVKSLYCDILGLLTVGIGCLADPLHLALPLPWQMPDGSLASQAEIAKQWSALKAQSPELKKLHWRYAAEVTTMRLTDDGVLQLCKDRLTQDEAFMRKYFPDWDQFPADLQLCCFSMAWAVGPGFPPIFGNFTRLVNAGDYKNAIQACSIKTDGNPGIAPRNAQNMVCLSNAWTSSQRGLPKGQLFWPGAPPDAGDANWALRQEAEVALTKLPALDLSHDAEGEEQT